MKYSLLGLFIMLSLILLNSGCSDRSLSFSELEKIDAHIHLRYTGVEFLDQAASDRFQVIAILTDHYDIPWQLGFLEIQAENRPQQFKYLTTFTMKGWDEPDWQQNTLNQLKTEFAKGALGVKVWKNIGMEFRDKNGDFVMIDNPGFDPIIDFIETNDKTLTGHIGEPRDCWLPLEQMIVPSNREYYSANPNYHMYQHPEYPSYETQISSYERMLEKHPNIRYVACHLGSIEWDMKELAKRLDRFPNMAVDLAARVDDIQFLEQTEVRDFFIQYQDRILYGTDLSIREHHDPLAYAQEMHRTWKNDWRYFATDSLLTIEGLDKPVVGMHLPPQVLQKIYYSNAKKWYPEI
jgi:predicted TIM-barrel fold metal-dependent hydrolase